MILLGQSAERLGVYVHHAVRGVPDPPSMWLGGWALCARTGLDRRVDGLLGLPGHGAPSALSIEHHAAACKREAGR